MKKFFACIAAFLFFATAGYAQSLGNGVTFQASCSATSALLLQASAGQSYTVTIENLGSTAVYVGNSSVTSSTGFLIPPVQYSSVTVTYNGSLYCVTASGSASLALIAVQVTGQPK